ncbi:MAG: hypothetical protein CO108_28920, partial [Deltaproteobacteria bacterium CG_4_9_14_3_um_filter_63_12]
MVRVVCIVLSLLGCGCSTTASFVMADGREIEGEILGSDATTITVAAEEVWCPLAMAEAEAAEVRSSGITGDHACVWSVADADRLEGEPRSSLGEVHRVRIQGVGSRKVWVKRAEVVDIEHPRLASCFARKC